MHLFSAVPRRPPLLFYFVWGLCKKQFGSCIARRRFACMLNCVRRSSRYCRGVADADETGGAAGRSCKGNRARYGKLNGEKGGGNLRYSSRDYSVNLPGNIMPKLDIPKATKTAVLETSSFVMLFQRILSFCRRTLKGPCRE